QKANVHAAGEALARATRRPQPQFCSKQNAAKLAEHPHPLQPAFAPASEGVRTPDKCWFIFGRTSREVVNTKGGAVPTSVLFYEPFSSGGSPPAGLRSPEAGG